MKHPQVAIYESDGFLASQVRRLASENGWLVRESRHTEACLALLNDGRPSVLLLKLEKDLVDGLSLLTQVTEQAPDCPVLLVSDVKMDGAAQRVQLSTLAFDLGARYILYPPLQQSVIEDLVAGFMAATVKRVVGIVEDESDA